MAVVSTIADGRWVVMRESGRRRGTPTGWRGPVVVAALLVAAGGCGGPAPAPGELVGGRASPPAPTEAEPASGALADDLLGITFESADDPLAAPPLLPTAGSPDDDGAEAAPEPGTASVSEPATEQSGPEPAEPSAAPEPGSTPEPPSSLEPPADGPADPEEPVIDDGVHPAYLVALDVAARSVSFDVIQFLTGDAAAAAFQEDEPDDPDDSPPNDYWIRNASTRVRTLPIATDATVAVVRLGEPSGAGLVPWTLEDLPAHLDRDVEVPAGRLAWNPYWLTVADGVVVAIEEQYLP
jgi:hypothetical protein